MMDERIEIAINNINQAIVDHFLADAHPFERNVDDEKMTRHLIHRCLVENTIEDRELKNKVADYILDAICFKDLAAKAYDKLAYDPCQPSRSEEMVQEDADFVASSGLEQPDIGDM